MYIKWVMVMKKSWGLIFTIIFAITLCVILSVSGCSANSVTDNGNITITGDAVIVTDLDSPSTENIIEEVYDFISDIAWFRGFDNEGRLYYGIVDAEKNIIVPPIYEHVFDFYTRGLNWIALAKNGKWGMIDTSGIETAGNVVVPFIYDNVLGIRRNGEAEERYNAVVEVAIDGKCGLLDAFGNVLVPCEYEDIMAYNNGKAEVILGGKWGIIDSNNNVIVPFEYAWITLCSNDVARVVIADGAYGRFQYSAPEDIWLKGKFGFVDMLGKVIVPIIYDYAEYLPNGTAVVRLDDYYGIIDMSGNIIVPVEYDSALLFNEDYRQEILFMLGK